MPLRSTRSTNRKTRSTGQARPRSKPVPRAARAAGRRPPTRSPRARVAQRPSDSRPAGEPLRFAVVGLGYFAQAAVLPAFRKAKGAEVVALVSDDATKLRELGEEYGIEESRRVRYEGYDDLLASGEVDAVYICLPNDLHAAYTVRAARHGVHVLCEKPLAVTAADCRRMVEACDKAGVRLMTAYRLHFNDANLEAIQAITDGDIGTPRFFVSSFATQVKPGGIRTRGPERGGGPLYDIGIYCINAARYLFRAEPSWVFGSGETGQDQARFRAIDEQVTCVLGFPEGRTATFTASYGAADVACYEVYGTAGSLCLENAYEFSTTMRLEVEGSKGSWTRRYLKRDQVAPEITHFADCIRSGKDPEPSGKEGLIDVAIIEALQRSITSGKRIDLTVPTRRRRPTEQQAMRVRGSRMPELVNAKVPFQD
jgi:predicted dehydrogenase